MAVRLSIVILCAGARPLYTPPSPSTAICRRFGVRRLDVFGSASRGTDFDPEHSDVDFLVEFDGTAVTGLHGFLGANGT